MGQADLICRIEQPATSNKQLDVLRSIIKIIYINEEKYMPITLLIVDDDDEILSTMKTFFTKKSYLVLTASNGLEGLKMLDKEEQVADILITDIIMPGVGGVALISVSRKKFPQMPIIAITGWGEHPEELAVEAKADIVLKKPIELIEVERHILALMAS